MAQMHLAQTQLIGSLNS